MAREIKDALVRSRDHLLLDALGAAALVMLLLGGLYLPALF